MNDKMNKRGQANGSKNEKNNFGPFSHAMNEPGKIVTRKNRFLFCHLALSLFFSLCQPFAMSSPLGVIY